MSLHGPVDGYPPSGIHIWEVKVLTGLVKLSFKRNHIFQNIGDGTYNHSGLQAIRASIAANINITYKILFNDAVAMTEDKKMVL